MLGYAFIIEYIAGKTNRVADALSRQAEKGHFTVAETCKQEQKLVELAALSVPVPSWLEEIGILFFKPADGTIETTMQGEQIVSKLVSQGRCFVLQRIYLESSTEELDDLLRTRDKLLRELKENLSATHLKMKQYHNLCR